MSRTDWPQECPDIRETRWLGNEWMEIRRRWRIEPAAVRLSDALDSYLKADHNSDARKLETDYIELLDAQRDFEKASK